MSIFLEKNEAFTHDECFWNRAIHADNSEGGLVQDRQGLLSKVSHHVVPPGGHALVAREEAAHILRQSQCRNQGNMNLF